MKTLRNLKSLIVSGTVVIFTMGVVLAQVLEPVPPQTEPPASTQVVSPFETPAVVTPPVMTATTQIKNDINSDLSAVTYQRNRVQSLEKKYKSEKSAGRTTAMAATQKQLIRARGELALSKAYLKADKCDLINAHNVAIDARKDAIKRDKERLAAAKTRLNKDIATGNEATVDENALALVKHQNALKRDKARLSDAREAKNDDILAVNEKIKKANGATPFDVYAQSSLLKTENWMAMRK